ncbi:adenosine deaminase [Coccomyxa subellipsoidea C-169]|uniref:Adenosine deaminase n=1 Tax=Coccomyxa subellipsoidea (strain C-169) TaxID=574566 RepID=I0YU69_COCSC|nr:adenosine deaminase [Coccomyxa subellipsoidea C-169]EIE21938.1 adenosine deaminase [Coccomyxa subellipsoidea C-169]|eukprot:XP_005646482.1 adenosine deaminase [Coccomyxa subellipsoidea C-169]
MRVQVRQQRLSQPRARVAAVGRAELHLHIEGTLEPELLFELAARNEVLEKIPYKSLDEVRAAYNFQNLQSFLDLYYAGCAVLITEQDFYDMTWAYLERAAADKVVHTEIFFDPQTHTSRGVPFATAFQGITKALKDAEAKLSISSHIIMCFLRHLGSESAMATLQEALPYKEQIKGVGLDSSELGFPPSLFQEVFQLAAKEGFKLVAHAGEEGPAEYVWEAVNLLKVDRIDHGVKSIEDASLCAHLSKAQTPLTVCPLSNVKLSFVTALPDEQLVEKLQVLLRQGMCITINSDDPAYFGGYVNANYVFLAQSLGLDAETLYQLHRNSFIASFLSDDVRDKYLGSLDQIFKQAVA